MRGEKWGATSADLLGERQANVTLGFFSRQTWPGTWFARQQSAGWNPHTLYVALDLGFSSFFFACSDNHRTSPPYHSLIALSITRGDSFPSAMESLSMTLYRADLGRPQSAERKVQGP